MLFEEIVIGDDECWAYKMIDYSIKVYSACVM